MLAPDVRDALSDVLRAMRLRGGVFVEAEFGEPWCVLSQVGPEDCAGLRACEAFASH